MAMACSLYRSDGSSTASTRSLVRDDPDDVLLKIKDVQYPLEYRALVAAQFIMQARPQELVALEWSDIDLIAGTATINKRLAFVAPVGEDRKTDFKVRPGTKTGTSEPRCFPPSTI